jgi:Right handed beta helix region/Phospholipase_D-nuclease N-terminal
LNRSIVAGRTFFRYLWLTAYLLLALGLLAGCAGTTTQMISPGPVPTDQINLPALPPGVPTTLHVPADYPTIQAAVDAAQPGQIILIAPNVYHEAVHVKTPGITLRGEDRNRVILDGNYQLSNGVEIEANNVVVENMTARHYFGNGFYWDGGEDKLFSGFRGSYLTAYKNGDYGIYAYNFQNGEFDHSYAAGSPDSGFYIGQCYPCNAVIDDVTSEWNALGYSGTNAGGNLIIRDSTWHDNLTGILPNTLDSEQHPPEHQTVVINNTVYNNNNDQAPTKPLEYPLIGTGIGVPGGVGNVVIDNHVRDQHNYGIIVIGNVDANFWVPSDNRVIDNVVTNSGVADLALAAPTGPGNCFSGNTATRTLPALIEQKYPCDSPLSNLQGGDPSISPVVFSRLLYANSHTLDPLRWEKLDETLIPASQNQPQMPNIDGPALPIFPDLSVFNLPAAAQLPSVASSTLTPMLSGGSSVFQFLLGLYGELLPVAIYAAWLALGFWDLARNEKLSNRTRLIWMVVLVAIPILGPIAYYIFGRSQLSRSFRVMFVAGAPVLYLALTVLLVWISSL